MLWISPFLGKDLHCKMGCHCFGFQRCWNLLFMAIQTLLENFCSVILWEVSCSWPHCKLGW